MEGMRFEDLRWDEDAVAPDDLMKRAARIVADAKRVVAFTGAGTSVESGIPDFRSAHGLWARFDPATYCSYPVFQSKPELFWEMVRALLADLSPAQPNAAHRALSDLQRLGLLTCVVTQNVDGLHQEAGSEGVVEVHGNARMCTCTACGHSVGKQVALEQLDKGVAVPVCPVCSGVLKLDVILFGEAMPAAAMSAAVAAAASADVLLVIGTSLMVAPANSLTHMCRMRGGRVIAVNLDPDAFVSADVGLEGKAGEVLPQLVAAVRQRLGGERRATAGPPAAADGDAVMNGPGEGEGGSKGVLGGILNRLGLS
ncbi:hypothetical protein CLOM_g8009 [Closterium sp. NIES-68]|nr:hypothetical protein CLOM_g8009 [Closterium sp. NIES-68]GJP85597.1 hypothetical protein CLOP_g15702 [Closterium sp. NIES-67]